MLTLTSCQTSGPVSPANTDSYCRVAQPIYLDPTDRLSEATKRQLVREDQKGRILCGWKPPT